jgi:hypothetical protein
MDRFKSLSSSADTYPENQEKPRYGKSTLDTLSKGQYIIVNRIILPHIYLPAGNG